MTVAMASIMDMFPSVKRTNEETFGTDRTTDKILEFYEDVTESQCTGRVCFSPLHPAPGRPTDEHGHFIPMSQWDPNHWPPHIHPPRGEQKERKG
jgi:hypothetical protein